MTHPRLQDAVQWLRELTAFETVPSQSNAPLILHVAERLRREHGIEGSQKAGGEGGERLSFMARIGPDKAGGVALSGHTDVVAAEGEWHTPPFQLSERDGKLYARGSCDMKGFVACALAMTPVFAAAPLKKPVYFAFSRDEEIGCAGSADMISLLRENGAKPEAAIVGEPTRMQIVSGHKAGLAMRTEFFGSPAHSSVPAEGVSAVAHAARFAGHLLALEEKFVAGAREDSPFLPPHATVNIGVMRGGEALNILAARCVMEWHYRGMPEDDVESFEADINRYLQETLLPQMRAGGHPADIRNTRISSYPGLAARPSSPALLLAQELAEDASVGTVSFGTEAGHFQQAGIESVVIGPGDIDQAHKPDEYLEISQMSECLEFLDNLCARLCK